MSLGEIAVDVRPGRARVLDRDRREVRTQGRLLGQQLQKRELVLFRPRRGPEREELAGDAVPDGLLATILDLYVMLPCVGPGAIGIEIRADDGRIIKICERLNHFNTFHCVTAERAFLRAMGGGCQSPVAAHAEITGDKIFMRAISYCDENVKRGEAKRPVAEAALLGEQIAAELK